MKIIRKISLLCILFVGACAPAPTQAPKDSEVATQVAHAVTQTPAIPLMPSPTQTATLRPRPKPGDALDLIQGMSFASWEPDAYENPVSDRALEDLAATGTNWVAIVVTTTQKDNNSTEINAAVNSDESIIHAIQTAHRLNLNVMLKPHVDFSADDDHWRGQIGQSFNADQWEQWFNSYSSMILRYAKLAEVNGVEVFCIGTELNVPQQQTARFQKLAADVRAVFSGPITYASNWDAYQHEWWDSVDYIGVDAYFPLTETRAPSVEEVVRSWESIRNKLEALSVKWNRPVMFTEIGYSSQEYAARSPAGEDNGAISPQTQANLYKATFDVFRDKPWFQGMFWWMWEATPYAGGMCDYHHTPKGKLAENILRAEYGVNPLLLEEPAPLPIFDEQTIRIYSIFADSYGGGIDPAWSWGLTEKIVQNPVAVGQNALEINFQGWSGFSPYLNGIDTTPFEWLEFYIYVPSDLSDSLIIDAANAQDRVAYKLSLTRCNYFDNASGIKPNQWNRVLIPLEQIDADKRIVSRFLLEYWASEPVTIWIDEIRLVGRK